MKRGRPRLTINAKRNQAVWKKMGVCERETGKTAAQLAAEQRQMRMNFYGRRTA